MLRPSFQVADASMLASIQAQGAQLGPLPNQLAFSVAGAPGQLQQFAGLPAELLAQAAAHAGGAQQAALTGHAQLGNLGDLMQQQTISIGGFKMPIDQAEVALRALTGGAGNSGRIQQAPTILLPPGLGVLPQPAAAAPQRSGDSRSGSAYASRHQAAEQRRRLRINERLDNLRKLVPHAERANTACFLEEVIKYISQLREHAEKKEQLLNQALNALQQHQPSLAQSLSLQAAALSTSMRSATQEEVQQPLASAQHTGDIVMPQPSQSLLGLPPPSPHGQLPKQTAAVGLSAPPPSSSSPPLQPQQQQVSPGVVVKQQAGSEDGAAQQLPTSQDNDPFSSSKDTRSAVTLPNTPSSSAQAREQQQQQQQQLQTTTSAATSDAADAAPAVAAQPTAATQQNQLKPDANGLAAILGPPAPQGAGGGLPLMPALTPQQLQLLLAQAHQMQQQTLQQYQQQLGSNGQAPAAMQLQPSGVNSANGQSPPPEGGAGQLNSRKRRNPDDEDNADDVDDELTQ